MDHQNTENHSQATVDARWMAALIRNTYPAKDIGDDVKLARYRQLMLRDLHSLNPVDQISGGFYELKEEHLAPFGFTEAEFDKMTLVSETKVEIIKFQFGCASRRIRWDYFKLGAGTTLQETLNNGKNKLFDDVEQAFRELGMSEETFWRKQKIAALKGSLSDLFNSGGDPVHFDIDREVEELRELGVTDEEFGLSFEIVLKIFEAMLWLSSFFDCASVGDLETPPIP